jgi:hypothetical protein
VLLLRRSLKARINKPVAGSKLKFAVRKCSVVQPFDYLQMVMLMAER